MLSLLSSSSSDEMHILRMRGRFFFFFPVVLWLRVHVCHVAGGGGYEWEGRVLSDDGSWRNHV